MSALAIEHHVLHERELDELLSAPTKTAIVAPTGTGKTRLLRRVLDEHPDLVFVQVPRSTDQIERTILELGAALGPTAREEVAARLGERLDDPQVALEVLDGELNGHRLIVDDFDAIQYRLGVSELSDLMAPSRRSLERWLSSRAAFVGTARPLRGAKFGTLVLRDETPPWEVGGDLGSEVRGLWQAAKSNKELFRAALAYYSLHGAPPESATLENTDELMASVWEMIPESVQEVMTLLANYGAVFPAQQFREIVEDIDNGTWALDYARDVLLIESTNDDYWLSPGWQAQLPRLLEGRAEQAADLRIAGYFAGLVGRDHCDPRWVQAAHRHFVRAGDFDQAREFMRFGVGALLEAARTISLDGQHGLAAEYYHQILQFDRELELSDKGHGIGSRNRGYARHYYHYNRYKDGKDKISRTERGYAESVAEYPDNALFWSRLIVCRFQRDRWDEALATHATAQTKVTSETAAEKYLLGRTVSKLIERDLDNAAVVIWGSAEEVSEPKALSARYSLHRRTQRGWMASVLRVPGLSDTFFERPVRVEFGRSNEHYRCIIKDVGASVGSSMLVALTYAIERGREETAELLQTNATSLSPRQRLRKRLLLGLVDVIESEIRGPSPEYLRMLGRVVEGPGKHVVFVPVGAEASTEYYEFDEALARPAPGEDILKAKVATGRGGAPRGPVIDLAPLFATREAGESAKARLVELLGE